MVDVNNVTAVITNTFGTVVENTATNLILSLPGLLIAILIFVLGWVVAVLISRLVAGVLKAIRLEDFLKDHKVEDALGTVRISNVLVKILKYYIILIFLQVAVSLVELGTLSAFLNALLVYAPVLIGAVLVALVAVILGEYVKEVILELAAKSAIVKFAARATKLVIIYVGVTMALATAGFDTSLISNIFLIILQALAYGIALAVGISFGLGGQKDAQDILGKWRKHLKL